jgi:hypothetical protein
MNAEKERALLEAELYQQISQLKVDLDWLKKSWTIRSRVSVA